MPILDLSSIPCSPQGPVVRTRQGVASPAFRRDTFYLRHWNAKEDFVTSPRGG